MQLFIKHTNIGLWNFMHVSSMNIQPSIVVSIRIHSANLFYIHSFVHPCVGFEWILLDFTGVKLELSEMGLHEFGGVN